MKLFTVSELSRRKHEAQYIYVVHWATHPDKGSAFDAYTRFLRKVPKPLLFFLLVRCLGYDGIICYDEGAFIGHVFFQKHRRHWGIFSVFVQQSLRDKDYAKRMIAECLKRAYTKVALQRAYIGNGGHPAIQHIAELAAGNQLGLTFSVKAGEKKGEVVFVRPAPSELSRRTLLEGIRKFQR